MLWEESHLFMFVPLHVRLLMSTPPTAPMSNDSLSTRVLTEHELYSCWQLQLQLEKTCPPLLQVDEDHTVQMGTNKAFKLYSYLSAAPFFFFYNFQLLKRKVSFSYNRTIANMELFLTTYPKKGMFRTNMWVRSAKNTPLCFSESFNNTKQNCLLLF